MAARKQILFIITSHDELLTGKKTGYWLSEVAHPYNELAKLHDITIATPRGGAPPMDPGSEAAAKDDAESQHFLADTVAQEKMRNSIKLSDVKDLSAFDAVVYPGGHGPVFDLNVDTDSQRIAAEAFERGLPLAAVCHGPAALLNVKLSNGELLVKGRRVTGFTNTEEEAVGLTKAVPYLLEDAFVAAGALYEKKGDWADHVVVDGNLITGQNPTSATSLAREVNKLLA